LTQVQSAWQALRRWLPVRVVSRYLSHGGPNQATLVAWNLLFAFFPILVLAVTLASLIPHDAAVGHGLVQAVANALPGGKGEAVAKALRTFHHDSGWLAIVGLVGLLWSGSSLFGAMDQAFASLAESKPRGFLAQKLMAFGMIILFSCLAIPIVLSSSLLAVLKSVSGTPALLRSGPVGLLLQIGLAIVFGAILFTAIYTLVPRARRRLRGVLPGSLAAAVLFEALTLLFPLYFKLAHGFKTYGSTFSLFFLILAYAFLVAQVTVLGFAVVLEAEQGRRTPDPPSPGEEQPPVALVR
jgi:membrane protein